MNFFAKFCTQEDLFVHQILVDKKNYGHKLQVIFYSRVICNDQIIYSSTDPLGPFCQLMTVVMLTLLLRDCVFLKRTERDDSMEHKNHVTPMMMTAGPLQFV